MLWIVEIWFGEVDLLNISIIKEFMVDFLGVVWFV